ncbi:MAG TPA: sialidase family protein [Candidatus Acidoferrum sp.]|nr:sialidase family protein [Candidatus Acidoferrum sp.]
MRHCCAATAEFFLCTAVLAQTTLSPAPGRRVVTVSAASSHGNEPSIAVDPNNSSRVVAAFQPATISYSTDGAQTFTTAELPPVEGWRGGGDVSVAFDNKGHAYLGTLHFDKLGSQSYWAHGAGRNGIFVRRSLDGGKTWEKDAVAIKIYRGNEPDIQWEDMPRVFADAQPHSPYAGNVYLGWIEWQLDKSIILFARSTDSGKTFSKPMRISTHAGLPRDDNGGLVGFVGAVGADGTVYAIWNDGSTITFAQSHDGGRSFEPSRVAIEVAPPYFGGAGGIPGVSRVMGFPQIGVDARPGKNGGALYLVWSDYRNGDVDVFCVSSNDYGKTWSKPVRVNSDPIHDGIDQFFQWMTVDPASGEIYIQFYDRRDDPANRRTGFTLARSTDGGKSFVNYVWSDTLFESQNAFLGDYTWLVAYDRKVYGIWTEALPPSTDSQPPQPGRPQRSMTVVRVGFADFSTVR